MPSADFDARSAAELREHGSLKWSMYPDTIGAFVAEMDFGIAPEVSAALHAAIDGAVTGYLPADLADAMSAATAAWYRDAYGWAVPAARVHPVADVIAAFELAIQKYSRPGSKVIVPTPAYMPFLFVPQALGREVIEVPSVEVDGRWRMDLAGVERAFDDGGHLLVLCNPHNPLGTVATRDELRAIADLVERRGGRVFSDEIHAPLVYAGSTHVPYASLSPVTAAHTVTATSASKAWNLAGLKCAQVILSNDADEAHWQTFGAMASHGASNLGVIGNTAAYTSGGRWLGEVLEYLDGNRMLVGEMVAEHLPGIAYTAPEGTYIAWLDFRTCGIEGDVAEFFRANAGVALTDGAACGEVGAGFARFVFALPRPLLREAFARMGDALRRRATPLPVSSTG
ncbi:MalY/PatB family protein [Planctomonas deserti]|uniref:MalY/PatB family protein n=1 Tax=Planctomonas deserti TaxID=2144185 RepID=UPI000D3D8DB6|nr:aminotransferase class I/II-fold pyridoxal phosphate-dependent enzyme [Planctomonas deserti]